MSQKKDIQVLIGGKVYTLSGEESEEYIQRVALYMNTKMSEVQSMESTKKLNSHMVGILLALNVADDYLKLKDDIEYLLRELEAKNQLIKQLEQEVVNERMKIQNTEIQLEKAKEEIDTLKEKVSKYKSELDEFIETFEND